MYLLVRNVDVFPFQMTLAVLVASQYLQLRLLLMLDTVQSVFALVVMETSPGRNSVQGQ